MKPLKPLDPFRPNLLPKAVSNDKSTDYNVSSNVIQTNHRDYVKELVEKSKIGKNDRTSTDNYTEEDIESMAISNNKRRIDRLKTISNHFSRTNDANDMFTFDKGPLDTFALPGRPHVDNVLPGTADAAKNRALKSRQSKTVKVKTSNETFVAETKLENTTGVSEKKKEFSFLAGALNMAPKNENDEIEVQQNVNFKPNTQPSGGGGQTADLDEIAVIMEGIKTGDDAINFLLVMDKKHM